MSDKELGEKGLAKLEHLLRYCDVDTESVAEPYKNGINYTKAITLKEIIALVREHDNAERPNFYDMQKAIRVDERQRCIDVLREELIMTGNHEYHDELIMKLVKKLEAQSEG